MDPGRSHGCSPCRELRSKRPQKFAEAKEAVRAALLSDRAAGLAKEKVVAIRAEIARTGSVPATAPMAGITWQTRAGVTRNTSILPAEVRTAAFSLPRVVGLDKPLSITAKLASGRLGVVVVSKVSDEIGAISAPEREMLGASLHNLSGQRVFEAYLARLQAKARIDRRAAAAGPTPAG